MRQWQIVDFPFPNEAQPHPFVILSPDEIAGNADHVTVNALMCVTVRGDYQLKARDVRLDQGDGLDWPTVVRCHFIFALSKDAFHGSRGIVSRERRRQIARTVQACFEFAGL